MLSEEKAAAITELTRHKLYGIVGKNVALNYNGIPKRAVVRGQNKGACIVTSSGPSLISAIPWLKTRKERIFSSPTHKGYLELAGIYGDELVYDHGLDMHKFVGTLHKGTKLYVHPGIHPSVMENWPNQNKIFWYWWYTQSKTKETEGETVKEFLATNKIDHKDSARILYNNPYQAFINDYVPMLFPELQRMVAVSCTPLMAAIIALVEGYRPIYLVGFDLCWRPGKIKRTPKMRWAMNKWVPWEDKTGPKEIEYLGLTTTENELFYRLISVGLLAVPDCEIYNVIVDDHPTLSLFQSIDVAEVGNVDVLAKLRADLPNHYAYASRLIQKERGK